MKPAALLALLLACAPAPALAQTIVGRAVAVDGDTLDMTGVRIRLFGIDAVERGQTCERAGVAWRCGDDAHALLGELVEGRVVSCQQRDTDVYGRTVAVCRAGSVDLSAAIAGAGLATALPQYSDAYLAHAERAKAQRLGIWGAEFVEPAAYRAANPRNEAPARVERREDEARAAAAWRAPQAVSAAAGVYYRNCDAARAAGAAPLYRGQPGYRPEMDGDGDGIACEPYRGRR